MAAITDALIAELDVRGYDASRPWYFPSIGEYAPRVEAHGLELQFSRPSTTDAARRR